MMKNKTRRLRDTFPSALEDARAAELCVSSPQTLSPSYRLAYNDIDFLLSDELRPVRLQLELLKPEIVLREHKIEDTIIIVGSARIPEPDVAEKNLEEIEKSVQKNPSNELLKGKAKTAHAMVANSKYYEEAQRLSSLIAQLSETSEGLNPVIITGGGPGIMEAANRGAHDAGAESIGLNIVLPFEQKPNEYITPELCFQFHYFAIRKMHFLMRAKALVVFPGGYGTLDELFETLTLIQTSKIKPIPVLLFGREFWDRIINFNVLIEEGVISPSDIDIFQYVETADDVLRAILEGYK
jgi:uncharacterized protein (TIGR00730 family)